MIYTKTNERTNNFCRNVLSDQKLEQLIFNALVKVKMYQLSLSVTLQFSGKKVDAPPRDKVLDTPLAVATLAISCVQ